MRVVHLVPALFGDNGGVVGGAERYALELARTMADRVPTRLVSFGPAPRQERLGQLDISILGPAWHVRGQRTNPWHSGLLRAASGADVVHCHQQHVLCSSLSAALCRLSGRRVFVSDLGGGGWDVSAYLSTDRWYHGHLHISQYSCRVYGHKGGSRARVIYGGVDSDKFSPDPSVPREPLVVYVGRLLPHKGINYLIEGLPEGLALEVIGKPYHAEYFALLQRLAAGKPVRFRTDCDDLELVRAYRRALTVVLPSVYRTVFGTETQVPELLGQTLLEGMACGAPAVCTDVASMPEVVVDGVTGFVVPPNDPEGLRACLTRFRDDPSLVADLGRNARQRVLDTFNWNVVIDRCLEAYGEK